MLKELNPTEIAQVSGGILGVSGETFGCAVGGAIGGALGGGLAGGAAGCIAGGAYANYVGNPSGGGRISGAGAAWGYVYYMFQ